MTCTIGLRAPLYAHMYGFMMENDNCGITLIKMGCIPPEGVIMKAVNKLQISEMRHAHTGKSGGGKLSLKRQTHITVSPGVLGLHCPRDNILI